MGLYLQIAIESSLLKRRKETNSWNEDATHDKLLQQNYFISPEGTTLLSR